jgi:lipopolysaccharide export LptBFGC system permease protein LptF
VTTILVIILILLLLGAIPVYPYSRSWGPYPAGGILLVLVVLLVLILLGRL